MTIAEAFAAYQGAHPGEGASPVEAPPAVEPQVTPAAEPAAPPAAKFSFDEVLPDDPRLPASMRGKPISALLDYNHEKDIAAQRAAQEKNEYKAKYEATKAALEAVSAIVPPIPRLSPESTHVRASEKMRRSGVDPSAVFTDAGSAFDALGEVSTELARESLLPEIKRQTETYDERIARLEQESRNASLRNAFLQAKPDSISLENWNEDAPMISSYVVGNSRNPFDPASYKEASDWLDASIEASRLRKSGNGKGQPAVVAAPPTPPRGPAPPVGNGEASPPRSGSPVKVPVAVRAAMDDVTAVLQRVTHSKQTTDSILEKMRENNPRWRDA